MRVRHSIDRLAADFSRVPVEAAAALPGIVNDNIKYGRDLAKVSARETAGEHGKHYPKAITAEMTGPTVGEYGPDASRPQGGMSFEFGSRNQKPHLDLARSADRIPSSTAHDVQALFARLFR